MKMVGRRLGLRWANGERGRNSPIDRDLGGNPQVYTQMQSNGKVPPTLPMSILT